MMGPIGTLRGAQVLTYRPAEQSAYLSLCQNGGTRGTRALWEFSGRDFQAWLTRQGEPRCAGPAGPPPSQLSDAGQFNLAAVSPRGRHLSNCPYHGGLENQVAGAPQSAHRCESLLFLAPSPWPRPRPVAVTHRKGSFAVQE